MRRNSAYANQLRRMSNDQLRRESEYFQRQTYPAILRRTTYQNLGKESEKFQKETREMKAASRKRNMEEKFAQASKRMELLRLRRWGRVASPAEKIQATARGAANRRKTASMRARKQSSARN